MSRLGAAFGLDLRIQAHSKRHSIGVVEALLFGLGARYFFPAELMSRALPAFYLLRLGGTTYMVGASLILMEKSAGTMQALLVSPVPLCSYLGGAMTSTAALLALFLRFRTVAPR